MNKSILIVEDDPNVSELIETTLSEKGYAVKCAYSGTEAMLLLEKSEYDLIITDLMLPGTNGEEIVKFIGGRTPVIVVSAKAGIDDKVNNLLNGAADYLTKPFSPDELAARVEVQLRKNSAAAPARFDEVYIDGALNTAFAGGVPLKLTKTEFALLSVLLSAPKRIFSKSQLIELTSCNIDVWDSSFNVHICNLRKKLSDANGKNYIEAIWGIGYRFLPDKKS